MRGSKYNYKRAIVGPSAKRHLNADDDPKLNAGLVALWFFQGAGTSIAKRPFILLFFRGVRTP